MFRIMKNLFINKYRKKSEGTGQS
ncbi:MAG: hypothetical protein R2942_19260 [Ignavibacteria bacterium]